MEHIEKVLITALSKGLANQIDEVNEAVEGKRKEASDVARSIAALSWKADILTARLLELESHEKNT